MRITSDQKLVFIEARSRAGYFWGHPQKDEVVFVKNYNTSVESLEIIQNMQLSFHYKRVFVYF